LNDISTVSVSAPVTGQTLWYNGTNWVNANLPINDLSDVVITSPATGNLLQYNGTNWVNVALSALGFALDDLSDVVITSATTGDLLQYNGTNWVNIALDSLGLVLDDLADVVITSATTSQTLRYNGTNWVNTNLNLDDLNDVIITSVATDELLQYNGTNWVNVAGNLNLFVEDNNAQISPINQPSGTLFYAHSVIQGDYGGPEWVANFIAYTSIKAGNTWKWTNDQTFTQLPELEMQIIPNVTSYFWIKGIIYVTTNNANRTVLV